MVLVMVKYMLCCTIVFGCALAINGTSVKLAGVATMRLQPYWFSSESLENLRDPSNDRERNQRILLDYMKFNAHIDWFLFVDERCDIVRRFYDSFTCREVTKNMRPFASKLPYVRALLKQTRFLANKCTHIIYLNADALIDGNIEQAIRQAHRSVHQQHILIGGYARAFRAKTLFDFSNASNRALFDDRIAEARVFEHPGWALEAFIVDAKNPLFQRLPFFVVGRMRWDNWVMQFAALHKSVAAIDGGNVIRTVHLEHGDSDEKPKDLSAMRMDDPINVMNKLLSDINGGHNWGNIASFNHELTISGDEVRVVERNGTADWTKRLEKQFGRTEWAKLERLKVWLSS